VKEIVKRILMLLTVALVVVALFVSTAAPAFAKIERENSQGKITQGKGHPAKNPSGKCPPGANKDTSPGGLKKC
jgi:hypothetical protein